MNAEGCECRKGVVTSQRRSARARAVRSVSVHPSTRCARSGQAARIRGAGLFVAVASASRATRRRPRWTARAPMKL